MMAEKCILRQVFVQSCSFLFYDHFIIMWTYDHRHNAESNFSNFSHFCVFVCFLLVTVTNT